MNGRRTRLIREAFGELRDRISALEGSVLEAERETQHSEIARRLLEELRGREAVLPAGLVSDPAWEMLLELYIARAEGRETSVADILKPCRIASASGFRWIERLERLDLLVRRRSTSDKRAVSVALTDAGADKMTALLIRYA
ncbi:MAG: winged helix DNA-binding protein [Allosphingosinicella sp.]|uniref:winged helix DNA-binding protein n=1 Tax=Allosphingosinicella sp. TaxID=2823234 RepID=UPI00395F64F2